MVHQVILILIWAAACSLILRNFPTLVFKIRRIDISTCAHCTCVMWHYEEREMIPNSTRIPNSQVSLNIIQN